MQLTSTSNPATSALQIITALGVGHNALNNNDFKVSSDPSFIFCLFVLLDNLYNIRVYYSPSPYTPEGSFHPLLQCGINTKSTFHELDFPN